MELRILEKADGTKALQMRQWLDMGSIAFTGWGKWQDVPTVKEDVCEVK